jgi:prepilin-type N-terminal cleavage/methylation domain-containing protein
MRLRSAGFTLLELMVVVGVVAILALSYYLLVESPSLFDGLLRLFPRAYRSRIELAADEIATKVSSWLVMQAILAFLIGATSGLGLWLMGVPYASVLALIAAIGELVPYIGPLLAAVPAILVAASVSWQLALGVAIFFLLQQQLENHVLVPKLMGDHVGLSAAGVIIALLLGGSLLGVLGAILAIPTAAIAQVVARHALAGR